MRVIVILLIVAVLGGGAYLFFFKPDLVKQGVDQVKKGVEEARGYGPAKTPDQAVDKFKSAVNARDYQTAAGYVSGTYATQLQRGADASKALGESIDGLTALADKFGITLTDKVKVALHLLDPATAYAAHFEVVKVVPRDAEHATAHLTYPSGNVAAELKKEGEAWKIVWAEPAALRQAVDLINSKHKDYCRALDKVKEEIRSKSIITKDDLEGRLIAELDLARK